jgi:hypothetical protein
MADAVDAALAAGDSGGGMVAAEEHKLGAFTACTVALDGSAPPRPIRVQLAAD